MWGSVEGSGASGGVLLGFVLIANGVVVLRIYSLRGNFPKDAHATRCRLVPLLLLVASGLGARVARFWGWRPYLATVQYVPSVVVTEAGWAAGSGGGAESQGA